MRPRTSYSSSVVATTELGSAVAPTRDNAVPDQLCWQVRFFGHLKPLCCYDEAVPRGRNAKALVILKYLLALIPIGLIALLGAGCQEGEAANNQGETLVEETGEPSSEIKQTLAMSENILANIQKMQAKIAAREEAYASTGDMQGRQNMAEVGTSLEVVEQEVNSTQGTPDMALIRAEIEHIEDVTNETEVCCGLEPDFLSEDLQELRTQTDTLQNLQEQSGAEQTVPERAGPEQPKSPPAPKGEASPAPKEVPPPPPPGPPPPPP